jgi:hypothetical protein
MVGRDGLFVEGLRLMGMTILVEERTFCKASDVLFEFFGSGIIER